MAKLRVTAGLNELLSLVTFFAAAKKVTAAPHRGNANKPKRNRDPTKAAPNPTHSPNATRAAKPPLRSARIVTSAHGRALRITPKFMKIATWNVNSLKVRQ